MTPLQGVIAPIENAVRARTEPWRAKSAQIAILLRFVWGTQKGQIFRSGLSAPQVGLEPTTLRLTAECSAIELLRNIGIRRRPTLPDRYQSSTIGTEGLNFCVRYGNRWNPFVIATGNGELLNPQPGSASLRLLPFWLFRPSDLPFLPPSGLKVFSHPDNCTVSIQCKRLFSINLRITLFVIKPSTD